MIISLLLGAENGTRTRDLNLGKVALYQLSYFRNIHPDRSGGKFSNLSELCPKPHRTLPKRLPSWFRECKYSPKFLFRKIFRDEIAPKNPKKIPEPSTGSGNAFE